MTVEEAIRMLKYNSNVIHKTTNGETDPNEVEALDMAIKSLESLQTISNLFSKWSNGEVDDNQYYFQMQNLLLFGKTVGMEANE